MRWPWSRKEDEGPPVEKRLHCQNCGLLLDMRSIPAGYDRLSGQQKYNYRWVCPDFDETRYRAAGGSRLSISMVHPNVFDCINGFQLSKGHVNTNSVFYPPPTLPSGVSHTCGGDGTVFNAMCRGCIYNAHELGLLEVVEAQELIRFLDQAHL